MATDFYQIGRAATLSIKDEAFRDYLLTRNDVMAEYVLQYFEHMENKCSMMTMFATCTQTWKRVSQDYCAHTDQDWIDFINSDAFIKAGISLTAYLGNIHLDNMVRGVKIAALH